MAARFPFVKEARRLGLMAALELDRDGADIVRTCIDRGLLVNCTHETVLRVVPATNVPVALLDEGLDILEAVLAEVG
jgi:acetylornithine/succinyldiaminopimelate/putrescine aminotransferase